MLPKFIKVFPHEYNVSGIPKTEQTIPLPSPIAIVAVNTQVVHG